MEIERTSSLLEENPKRLYIKLKKPNPLFENWLEVWLADAERRNVKSQYKLREALHSLKSYPLPLASGRECAVLRGFGVTLCNMIDEELRLLKLSKPEAFEDDLNQTYQQEIQQAVDAFENRSKKSKLPEKKLTKKQQLEKHAEEERQRQVIMSPGDFDIWLLVDTQETNGKNKKILDQTRSHLENLKVRYEVRRLTVGDFLWIARDHCGNELVLPYIIERKRMDDLASSIRDGRFHEQKHRLRNCGVQNVTYLIEDYGDNTHVGLPLDNLLQSIVNTQVHSHFTTVHTENHLKSMVYLQTMTQALNRLFKDKVIIGIEKQQLGDYDPKSRMCGLIRFRELYEDSSRNAQLTVKEVFLQQLLQLHSLSLEKAIAIVEAYPTPRLLLDAYENCVSKNDAVSLIANLTYGPLKRSIGEKISRILYEFFKTTF